VASLVWVHHRAPVVHVTALIASVSGGKDSTAMCLYLLEIGRPFRAAFWDTGWEHPETYRYVTEVLPDVIGGPVEIRSREPVLDERREAMAVELEGMLGFRSPMVRWVLSRAMFPSRKRKWCTQELKVFTARDFMRAEHAAGRRPVNVVGIRAAESPARAAMPEHELSTTLDCMVWRPLLRWSEQDVIDIHRRHGVAPNPLYLRGAARVGCWPCIQAGKAELRLLDEARIHAIERLEVFVAELASEAGRAAPALFQHPTRNAAGERPCTPIREIVRWAFTSRGGRDELDPDDVREAAAEDGCMRWGMCDLPGEAA
jgi:3'-phosphoadenosine 5'-phosphosulfate sulfotransferase (PAPS reductase)/FAD synthetase